MIDFDGSDHLLHFWGHNWVLSKNSMDILLDSPSMSQFWDFSYHLNYTNIKVKEEEVVRSKEK